jgi:hypothetical protein
MTKQGNLTRLVPSSVSWLLVNRDARAQSVLVTRGGPAVGRTEQDLDLLSFGTRGDASKIWIE